jgi:aspartate/methionine/tyrosine aminotransferase
VAISTGELQAAAERARAAAAEAGELRPASIGKVTVDLPATIRVAIREDLASGAYHQAAREAVAGDPDLVQG